MLTDTDRAILDVETHHWRHAATKEAAVRDRLGLTPTRYYQALARLAHHPDAIAHAPAVCARLRAVLTKAARR